MRVLSFFVVLLLFAGCCKVYCDGSDLLVSFEKLKARDTDTVVFVNYLPATGLTRVVDTFRILTVIPATDTTRSSVAHSISSSYEWKVLLPSVNKQYVFENFELSTRKCSCRGTKYKDISGFTLNGVRQEGSFIRVE